MKKILLLHFFLLFLAGTVRAQSGTGSITFFNTTGCTVMVSLFCDDNLNPGHCFLVSWEFGVPPFTPITFNNTAQATAFAGGWFSTYTPGAITHHWDGMRWRFAGSGGCSIGRGGMGSCPVGATACMQSSVACGTITGTYIGGNPNDIVTFN